MFRSFEEVESYLLEQGIKRRIALCAAHDEAALAAVVEARRKGIVEAMLIGDEPQIRSLLEKLGEDPAEYAIVHETGAKKAARAALRAVHDGEADIPMKGLLQTASFIPALMNPLTGITAPGAMISHTTVFRYPPRNCLLFATDTSFAMNPTLEEKVVLINNAAELIRAFGYEHINVGVISAVEDVRDNIPSTQDAEALSQMSWADDITVEGPFALDNAIDEEAALHKGVTRSIAGKVDLLLLPDFLCGNILYKSIHYFGHLPEAGCVTGTVSPAVLASRSDTPESKYYSILCAVLQSARSNDNLL